MKNIFYVLVALATPLISNAQWNADNVNAKAGLPTGTITGIVISVMQWILVILGAIGVIGFVVAGIIYLTSAGDDNRIGTAKKAMLYSIIGVIVGLMGYVIIQAVNQMLGGNSTTF